MRAFKKKKTVTSMSKHLITVESITSLDDGQGGFTQATEVDSVIWAGITTNNRKQHFDSDSISVDATHIITTYGTNSISEKAVIKFGSREFEVLTVENLGELDFEKQAFCKERV